MGSWVEQDFVQHCSAEYVDLRPTPRSTIAAAFSPDGAVVASTHGDHTVKVSDCATGRSVQVMNGHMRTPWVVRFNPADSNMLASGSLDHLVNIWQLNTGHRLQHHDFGRPIASIAFHPGGELMAVASGHKVYMWQYGVPDKSPTVVLKTKKSLRAIHFHPHSIPLLLTAEVVERKATPSVLDPAAPGAAAQPSAAPSQPVAVPGVPAANPANPPAPSQAQHQSADSEAAAALAAQQQAALHQLSGLVYAANHALDATQRQALLRSLLTERESLQAITSQAGQTAAQPRQQAGTSEAAPPAPATQAQSNWWWDWWLPGLQRRQGVSTQAAPAQPAPASEQPPASRGATASQPPGPPETSLIIPLVPQSFGPAYEPTWGWELSMSASAEAVQHVRERRAVMLEQQLPPATTVEQPCVVSLNLWPFNPSKPKAPLLGSKLCLPRTVLCSEMGAHFSRCGRYLAVAVQTDSPSEACEAWLRQQAATSGVAGSSVGSQQQPGPPSPGMPSTPSRFGVPASPAPSAMDDLQFQMELESGMVGGVPTPTPAARTRMCLHQVLSATLLQGSTPAVGASAGTSTGTLAAAATDSVAGNPDTRRPAAGHRPLQMGGGASTSAGPSTTASGSSAPKGPLFELRVYSLEGSTFGQILHARPIHAAHCLTSIQFSPSSDHLLVAYGRRHLTLCSLLLDGGYLTPVHTVLEVYRVSDMQLVRMLPTLDDEVNVAAWNPAPGGGGYAAPAIAYGTKEGKLRMLRYDKRAPLRPNIPLVAAPVMQQVDEELWEAEARARQRSDDSDG